MPVTREYLKEYLEDQPHVNQVTETVHGLLAHQDPSAAADTFGLIRTKGWAPDVITADREMVHFVKLDGDVLDDRPVDPDAAAAEYGPTDLYPEDALITELESLGYEVTAREIEVNTDDPVLDAEHHAAPKDENGDPVFADGGEA